MTPIYFNCDGAFAARIQMGSAAYVVRDHMRSLIGGSVSFIPCSYPVIAEAKAILEATMYASFYLSMPVLIESDSKVVIDAILAFMGHFWSCGIY